MNLDELFEPKLEVLHQVAIQLRLVNVYEVHDSTIIDFITVTWFACLSQLNFFWNLI